MKASESYPVPSGGTNPEERAPAKRASGGRSTLVPGDRQASGPEIVAWLVAENDRLRFWVARLQDENRRLKGAASALQRN